jgi:hypothetical protein
MIATHTHTRQKPATHQPALRHVVIGDLDFGMLDEMSERYIRDMAQLAKEGKGVTMPKKTGPLPRLRNNDGITTADWWPAYTETRADRF